MNQWPLISWARNIFIIGVVLSLICIIPVAWFPLQLGKLAVFALCMFLAYVLFFAGGGVGGVFGKRGTWPAFLVALLPLAYLVSYYFSTDRSVGLLGFSIEGDTVLFVVLGTLAFILSFLLFRRIGSARALFLSLCTAGCVAVGFQFVVILLGAHMFLPTIFSNASVNLVGKWNDLGLLAGVVLCILLTWFELGGLSRMHRAVAGVLSLILLLLLVVVQFPVVWAMLLGFFAILGTWSYIHRTATGEGNAVHKNMVPWVSICGVFISGLLLLWGATFQGGVTKLFPVSSLEVRPALSSTLDIIRASHGNSVLRFFIGNGPETFGNDWSLHRPLEVNQSQFWNLDFTVGFSTFTTALDTAGVAGALLWLVPLLLVLLGFVRVFRASAVFSAREKCFALSLCLSALYLWCSTLVYVPSENIVLLAFVLSGAAYGFAMKSDASPADVQEHAPAPAGRALFTVALVLCILFAAGASVFSARRFVAEAYVNQSLYELGQNNPDGALAYAAKAVGVEKTGDTLQMSILSGTSKLQQIAAQTTAPTPALQAQFTSTAQTAIGFGQVAVATNPSDYRAYLALARVYDLLASVGVQGAYESAVQLYSLARTHNPTNPGIPLALARLAAAKGDQKAATAALSQALTLKPDYTDAILFVVQLNVANKDIPNAIRAAQAAVNSAPGVASIWFELGLLYYSNNNMKDAALALGKAVELEPTYANAKYFLGLADEAVGNHTDALQQFRDLLVTNPDSAEVKLILGNLEAGKPPFEGAEPPVTPKPQNRATAPVSQ